MNHIGCVICGLPATHITGTNDGYCCHDFECGGHEDVTVENLEEVEARKRELIQAHRDDRTALRSLTNWIVGGNG